MRDTQGYIKELRDEAKVASIAALVVFFDNEVQFVFSGSDAEGKLNDLTLRGGKVLAITGVRVTGDLQSAFFLRPLEQFQSHLEALKTLDGFSESIRQSISNAASR